MSIKVLLPSLFLMLTSCGDKEDPESTYADGDGDGFSSASDCDDSNADVNPNRWRPQGLDRPRCP